MDKSIGIIILAAGASTRLGQPKQLLIYQEHSLIFNTLKVAVNSGCAPIFLVLGAYGYLIFPEVRNFPVKIVKNYDWQEGINTSIKVGINTKKNSSPGQFKVHYSPGIPLRMNAKNFKSNEALMLLKKRKKKHSNFFYLNLFD